MEILYSLIILTALFGRLFGDKPALAPCQCGNSACSRLADSWSENTREVMISGDSTKDTETIQKWKWNSFTSILDMNDAADDNSRKMMCKAHKEGKKYGFYVDVHPPIDANSSVIADYTNTIFTKITAKFADMVALNLLGLLGNCDYSAGHVEQIKNIVNATISQIVKSTKVKVLCVLPWRPPCYETNCGITPFLATVCDAMILNPDSYFDYCDDACIAKATVQYSKITFGITEYEAYGFKNTQIMLGIPWHGYNYTCAKFEQSSAHGICQLAKKNVSGVMKCDVEGSRTKVNLGHIKGRPIDLGYQNNTYSKSDQAPFKVEEVKIDGNKTQTHMTWYEEIGSLFFKYELMKTLGLRGCVVYSGDDLTYTNMEGDKFNDNMWAWILHEMLASNSTNMKKPIKNTAGMMAGIGVAMFLLGAIMGTIISCIIFRRKKTLRAPFSQDPAVDDYRDDDNHTL